MRARYHYICDKMRSLMKLNDTPHRLALAFALGIFIAFSPWFGLHILSCILLAWVFRLNKVVVLTASFVNNPWTVVPMYAFCLWFGIRITGGHRAVPDIAWADLGFSDLFSVLKPFLFPFVAGTIVLGIVFSALSYFVFRWAVVRYRKSDAEAADPNASA